MSVEINRFHHLGSASQHAELRAGRWNLFDPPSPVEWTLRSRKVWLRPGLTFTPYANPTRCSANCSYCSEELQRRDATRLTAHTVIGDHRRYLRALDHVWRELAGFPMGLSLSGLEATSDPDWLLGLLELVSAHAPLFTSKVLYTNGSGLLARPEVLPALGGFTRIELHRAHPDEQLNHRLMRFNAGVTIRRNDVLQQTARAIASARIPLALVCILSSAGVSALADVERYLDWAETVGADRVIFRALSELGELYQDGKTRRWVDRHRTPIRALMEAVWPLDGTPRAGWTLEGATSGYYYYNERYRRRGLEVVFEGASYAAHDDAVKSGVVQKLVFHSTLELCGDWVPNSQVLGSYA